LRIGCGCFDGAGNNIVLNLPLHCELLFSEDKAAALLALAAECWHPDWAGIISKKAILERGFDGDRPFVDWMVYVSRAIHTAPPFATVVHIDGLGSIVIVQAEPPRGNDPDELRRIGQVEAAISV